MQQRGNENHKPGDEVLTTNQDYYSMLNALRQRQHRDGIALNITSVPTPPKKLDDLAEVIERAITPKTRVILVSHIVDATGQIFPVRRIADMAHAGGIQLIVDGGRLIRGPWSGASDSDRVV